MISRKFGTTLSVVFLVITGFAVTVADAATINCGDVVRQNTVLDADMGPCQGDGIVVMGDGVTLDLGGHTVSGSGSGVGIRIVGRSTRVTNGTLTGFADGVFVTSAFNTLERLVITGNGTGLSVFQSSLNVVRQTSIRNNRSDGVVIFRSTDNSIHRSVISGNGGNGVRIESLGGLTTRASGNRVEGNSISGNVGSGVVVTPHSDFATIGGNVIRTNGGHGIYLGTPYMGARVTDNIVLDNTLNGILVDQRSSGTGLTTPNSVRANTARDNGVQSQSFDLADRNPSCAGTSWSGNTFVTRNQACIN
jgi:parallel beta helix pectate lyase-like protein